MRMRCSWSELQGKRSFPSSLIHPALGPTDHVESEVDAAELPRRGRQEPDLGEEARPVLVVARQRVVSVGGIDDRAVLSGTEASGDGVALVGSQSAPTQRGQHEGCGKQDRRLTQRARR